jgi:hypothetical protein
MELCGRSIYYIGDDVASGIRNPIQTSPGCWAVGKITGNCQQSNPPSEGQGRLPAPS